VEARDKYTYEEKAKLQDVVLYENTALNTGYLLKRILSNGKEYEYALCNENGLFLKQCDIQCNCHEVSKNNRPKKITMCSSYQMDSGTTCLVDGEIKEVEISNYFSILEQTKIGNYYLTDYKCNDKMYSRGNYNNSEKKSSPLIILLVILILLY
jgi:hypothetical protein